MKKMTLEQFKEQFNIKLNNQQLKAVQSVQNPTAFSSSGQWKDNGSCYKTGLYDLLSWNRA
jgi:hypothetical protein